MHEYVPPPFPDRVNPVPETKGLPAYIVDLNKWAKNLVRLQEEAERDDWEEGENPFSNKEWLAQRICIYGRRIQAESGMINSDSRVKHWQESELPSNIS